MSAFLGTLFPCPLYFQSLPITNDGDDFIEGKNRGVNALVCGLLPDDGIPSAVGSSKFNVVQLGCGDLDGLGLGPCGKLHVRAVVGHVAGDKAVAKAKVKRQLKQRLNAN